jgi:hypothetical protein
VKLYAHAAMHASMEDRRSEFDYSVLISDLGHFGSSCYHQRLYICDTDTLHHLDCPICLFQPGDVDVDSLQNVVSDSAWAIESLD